MLTLHTVILLLFSCALSMQGLSQDSLYAIKIDSLWLHSYDRKLLAKKRETIDEASIQYDYCKKSKAIRCIIVLDKKPRESLLFFFQSDKLVMLSPVGQQPYFLLDDKIVSGKEMKHASKQLEALIIKAHIFLERGYKKIKGTSG